MLWYMQIAEDHAVWVVAFLECFTSLSLSDLTNPVYLTFNLSGNELITSLEQ
jgi:hypothetical protein